MNSKHILIAEDDVCSRIILSCILNKKGYATTLASDGQEALDIISKSDSNGHRIDLLITDIEMPRLKGTELIRSIRQSENCLPVIVMTGSDDDEILGEVDALGIEHILKKPLEKTILFRRIDTVFGVN